MNIGEQDNKVRVIASRILQTNFPDDMQTLLRGRLLTLNAVIEMKSKLL